MSEPKSSWDQVGGQLSALGQKLQLHFEQAAEEMRAEDEDTLKEALQSVGDAVDRAFTAVDNAARDDAVRDDARDVGRTLLDALDATFSQMGERFRSSVKRD